MATTIKITDYNSVETLNNADILLVNQNGQNKKVTKEKLLEDVNTSLNEKVNKSDIVESLNITEEGFVLGGKQGKVLNDNTKSQYSSLRENYFINGNSTKIIYGTAKLKYSNATQLSGVITLPIAFTTANSIKVICSVIAKGGTPFQQCTNISAAYDNVANVNFVATGVNFISAHVLDVDYIIIGM